MSNWNDLNQAAAALDDPQLPPTELMAIAAVQPSLWTKVWGHPSVYPDLRAWLKDRGVAPDPPSPAGAAGRVEPAPAKAPGPAGTAGPAGAAPAGAASPVDPPPANAPGPAGAAAPGAAPERQASVQGWVAPGQVPPSGQNQAWRPPTQAPGQTPRQAPMQAPGQQPGQTPRQAPMQAPGQGPGQTPRQGPGQGPMQAPGRPPGQTPGQGPGQTPGQGPGQTPGQGTHGGQNQGWQPPTQAPGQGLGQPQMQAPQAWAAPAPPPGAGRPGGPGYQPSPKRKKRTGLVVGIVAGAVVVVVVSAIALAALLGGDDEASGSQPTTTAASETGQANSSPPEPTTPGLASVGGSIELVTGADPVTYEAGEIPFTGTADLTGVDWAEVGFILSADGASIHSVTLLLDGGRLPAEFDFDVLIRQYLDEYEVLEGRVTAVMVEAGTVLELSLDGEAATGVLTFSDDLEVYGTNETRTLDLGSGQVYLTAAISKR